MKFKLTMALAALLLSSAFALSQGVGSDVDKAADKTADFFQCLHACSLSDDETWKSVTRLYRQCL